MKGELQAMLIDLLKTSKASTSNTTLLSKSIPGAKLQLSDSMRLLSRETSTDWVLSLREIITFLDGPKIITSKRESKLSPIKLKKV